jgi:hypothetical protein
MKICPKCNAEHEKPGLFCSRSCANSRQRPESVRSKISNTLAGRKVGGVAKGSMRAPRTEKTCPECGTTFTDLVSSNRKYCSDGCAKKNSGGYREGSGRSKSGYYKGIYCGSTYELCWAIYQLDHNVEFSRFEGILEYDGVRYIPDFIQGNTIIEIKGYENSESVEKKTNVAQAHGYDVIVLRKDDLQLCFQWVIDNYHTKKFHELYDGYKPEYSYVCAHCESAFCSDSKKNTKLVYCCRSCAAKGAASMYRLLSLSSKGRTQPFQG